MVRDPIIGWFLAKKSICMYFASTMSTRLCSTRQVCGQLYVFVCAFVVCLCACAQTSVVCLNEYLRMVWSLLSSDDPQNRCAVVYACVWCSVPVHKQGSEHVLIQPLFVISCSCLILPTAIVFIGKPSKTGVREKERERGIERKKESACGVSQFHRCFHRPPSTSIDLRRPPSTSIGPLFHRSCWHPTTQGRKPTNQRKANVQLINE